MSSNSEQPRPSPPPAICAQRVLHYAVLDHSVGFSSGHGLMFVDGSELGRVPCLAICEDNNPAEVLLYYCDRDWNMVGVSGPCAIAEAKKRADRIFPGSLACWVEAHFTQQDATRYFQAEEARYLQNALANKRCTFCGKKPNEMPSPTFEGSGDAWICGICIQKFYRKMCEPAQ